MQTERCRTVPGGLLSLRLAHLRARTRANLLTISGRAARHQWCLGLSFSRPCDIVVDTTPARTDRARRGRDLLAGSILRSRLPAGRAVRGGANPADVRCVRELLHSCRHGSMRLRPVTFRGFRTQSPTVTASLSPRDEPLRIRSTSHRPGALERARAEARDEIRCPSAGEGHWHLTSNGAPPKTKCGAALALDTTLT